jgi:hypothetical protein
MPIMRAPEQVGEFVVEARLGEGGMGAVYRVVDPRTGARHALKVLTALHDPEAVQRFVREGQALAAIGDHPNVVRVHAAGASKAGPYLVMQLCTGGDLKQRLRAGPLPPREAARIVLDVARGIAHVHARGIIHRDLKPENVLFDDAGQTRVSDFGLARVQGAGTLTATGTILGTPFYMAPEQVDGRDVDARADVWGLGALLIAALTGRPPYAGASPVNVFTKLLSEPPRWPSVDRPDTPPALEAIVRHAMARRPQDRYQRAADLAVDLERFLAGELDGPPPRRGRAALLAATGAVALLLALAALALRSPAPPTPPSGATVAAVPTSPTSPTPPTPPTLPTPPAPTTTARANEGEAAPLLVETPWRPMALAFLDDDRLCLVGAGGLLLVDATSGERLAKEKAMQGARALAVASGRIYVGTDWGEFGGRVQVLSWAAGALAIGDPLPLPCRSLITTACSADGTVLAVLDRAGDVYALSLPDGRALGAFDGPVVDPNALPSLAVSTDGRLVAYGYEGAVTLLSRGDEGLTELWREPTAGAPKAIAFISTRLFVAGTDLGAVQVFGRDSPGELALLEGYAPASQVGLGVRARAHAGPIRGFAVLGPLLLSVSGGPSVEAFKNELRAWQVDGGVHLGRWPGTPEVAGVAISPGGARWAVASKVGEEGLVEVRVAPR